MRQLTEDTLNELLFCAVKAAREAGTYIQKQVNNNHSINIKQGGDSFASQLVTEVDFMSQQIILHTLNDTLEKYDLGLLTEERSDDNSRMEKDYFWCIDPLDGTLPYTKKEPGYAVSIALVAKNGTSFLGVIYDPSNDKMYHAVRGMGAFCNNKPIKQTSVKTTLNVFTDRSFIEQAEYENIMSQLRALFVQLGIVNVCVYAQAGAVVNACKVLENTLSCYFKFPKESLGGGCLWDYTASACIFNETNAVVSDIFGNPLDLNRKDSCFMNHKGVIYASNQQIATIIQQLYHDLN